MRAMENTYTVLKHIYVKQSGIAKNAAVIAAALGAQAPVPTAESSKKPAGDQQPAAPAVPAAGLPDLPSF